MVDLHIELCAICQEPLDQKLYALWCGHIFHKQCILPLEERSLGPLGESHCPLCRNVYIAGYAVPLFFRTDVSQMVNEINSLKKQNNDLCQSICLLETKVQLKENENA